MKQYAQYKTITAHSKGLFKAKGSKFIALAYPVFSESEIKDLLEKLQKEYHDARHHCYAYRLKPDASIYRMNDANEPKYSAGQPILKQLERFELTNIIIVVVRYFGGTKLGIGGLIEAYRNAAKDAINNATIISRSQEDIYKLKFQYETMNEVMNIINQPKDKISQINKQFDESCELLISLNKDVAQVALEKLDKLPNLEVEFIETR
ncbi:MAG: YigZ family protein [Bacteroidetes bacterium]|nr:YigZ family protein [Bacteroidia bacterium]PCH67492.1 MAG: YigZ family protein [Bacteroidota bacterium]